MEQILDSTQSTPTHRGYAGFWLRFAAYIIDSIIWNILSFVFILISYGGFANYFQSLSNPSMIFSSTFWAFIGLNIIAGFIYFCGLESSSKQGTIGKIAVGIKVTNMSGERISLLNSFGRHLAMIPSGLIFFIGFIMAGLTEKKQALHDMMASTLVVKR